MTKAKTKTPKTKATPPTDDDWPVPVSLRAGSPAPWKNGGRETITAYESYLLDRKGGGLALELRKAEADHEADPTDETMARVEAARKELEDFHRRPLFSLDDGHRDLFQVYSGMVNLMTADAWSVSEAITMLTGIPVEDDILNLPGERHPFPFIVEPMRDLITRAINGGLLTERNGMVTARAVLEWAQSKSMYIPVPLRVTMEGQHAETVKNAPTPAERLPFEGCKCGELEIKVEGGGLRVKREGQPGQGVMFQWRELGITTTSTPTHWLADLTKSQSMTIPYDCTGASGTAKSKFCKRFKEATGADDNLLSSKGSTLTANAARIHT
jgi:hypothetical protein